MHSEIGKHVLITGASGGIGSALAVSYAGPGVCLTLWARDLDRLERVAAQCRARGAETCVVSQDSRDLAECRRILTRIFATCPVDVAILGAGVSSGILPDGQMEPSLDAARTMEINATATISLGALALELMRQRGRGRTAFISSIAAWYPLAGSPAYCAAKSAIAVYARAMRDAMAGGSVGISVIYPGYVDTPMSRRLSGVKPWCWPADKAAAHIRERLERGRDNIAFPWPLTWGTLLLNYLPPPVAKFFADKFTFTIAPDAESPAASGQDRHAD